MMGLHTAHGGLKCIQSRADYIKFIAYINKYYFQDTEQTEAFFGFQLKCDEDGKYLESILDYTGNITYCPEEFPAIVYYYLDETEDRIGSTKFRELYYKTFNELGIDPNAMIWSTKPARCIFKDPSMEHFAMNKCMHVCNGYCDDCEHYATSIEELY